MLVQRLHQGRVEHDDVDLLVQGHRPAVEVGGADVGETAVDRHDLGVQHARLEVPDPDADLEQALVGRLGGDLHEALVGVRPRQEDLDAHAALHGVRQAIGEVVVGHEVGGRDAHPFRRQLHQRPEEGSDVAPSRLRSPAYALSTCVTGLRLMGEAVDVVEEDGVGLDPVVEERGA